MRFASGRYKALKCALHCHFSWHYLLPLRRPSGLATVRWFTDAGFDVIALTEHAYESNLGLEVETVEAWQRMKGRDGTIVVVGLEASYGDDAAGRFGGGDCVGLFLREYVDCMSGPGYSARPLAWVLQKIHEQGGIAVIAHAASSEARHPVGDGIWRWRGEFAIDGWESYNGGCTCVGKEEVAGFHADECVEGGYVTVASPDSHTPFQAACSESGCTYAFVEEASLDGFRDALVNHRSVAFANGALYGGEEWVARFKEWRAAEGGKEEGLWCRELVKAGMKEGALVESLNTLSQRYATATPSTRAYQEELLGLSDLGWTIKHSEASARALTRAATVLSQRMLALNEEEMAVWYERSYGEGIEQIKADGTKAVGYYNAGGAGAMFPGRVCEAAEARAHLAQALAIDPTYHAARAALVNSLKKENPARALAVCEGGLNFADASPYLAALRRHLVRTLQSQADAGE